ncbi:Na+/Pi symporter [Tulasnella sp. UAMH 9824]|nr:Na+/Pi symporter [Tulasnella sp. UAMH 9824]
MPYHQYDYIFALGLIFAFADSYGIGANDVANSFATSVGSRSLTLGQAVILAAIMEFVGAISAGARVTSTIRNNIIDINLFKNDPAVLMLGMLCALVGSSVWVLGATKLRFPVSTTHSIVGAVIGVGIAAGGTDAVKWGWKGNGVATVFASWGIAPLVSGGFASIIYLVTKFGIMERQNSTILALWSGPFFFFTTTAILTMVIVYKGSPNLGLDKLSGQTTALAIVMTALVVGILAILFWVPYVHAKVVKGDYTLRWYHFFLGPLLWRRPAPEDAGLATAPDAVPDYYRGHHNLDTPDEVKHAHDPESAVHKKEADGSESPSDDERAQPEAAAVQDPKRTIDGPWIYPRNLWIILRYKIAERIWYNATRDVASDQAVSSNAKDRERLRAMHARAKQYPNKTEHCFSFVQVLTACTASFAHGSNDVANAAGPLSTIYLIWDSGNFTGSRSPTPVWVLLFCAAALVIGLATYGYTIMSVLGNRITLHSPSRGYTMELGAATTVVLASQLGLPVSTTQSIFGATVAVGICNGDLSTINWRMCLWVIFGWILTVPCAGTIAGCLFGIIINAPRFGFAG